MILFLCVIVGLISGLLGGLLGIGGGVITVPFLYYVYQNSNRFPNETMQVAVCTSLAVAIITSGLSCYFHAESVKFSILKWMIPFLILGCLIGAFVAEKVNTEFLSTSFATVALLLGLYFFFPKLPNLYIAAKPNASLSIFGLLIGTLSSMLGIGGGIVAFPILLGYQVPMTEASATSSAATFITTCVGTASFLIIGWAFPGYIDLPSWTAISAGSVITTRIGVRLTYILNVKLIKRIFGACLVFVALTMFLI